MFATLAAHLILQANLRGYEVTLGEAERPGWVAKIYAQMKKGIAKSLHIERLAIDIHLFKDDVYLDRTESHRELGEWWEGQHPLCRWGGRFGDGNHYSMEWEGRK